MTEACRLLEVRDAAVPMAVYGFEFHDGPTSGLVVCGCCHRLYAFSVVDWNRTGMIRLFQVWEAQEVASSMLSPVLRQPIVGVAVDVLDETEMHAVKSAVRLVGGCCGLVASPYLDSVRLHVGWDVMGCATWPWPESVYGRQPTGALRVWGWH